MLTPVQNYTSTELVPALGGRGLKVRDRSPPATPARSDTDWPGILT